MQKVKAIRKPKVLEVLKKKYEGVEEIKGFDIAIDMVMNARDVSEAVKILTPLLRQRLVLINPEYVEAIEIVMEYEEPAIKLYLRTKEVTITRYEVRVESILVYSANPWC